MEKLQLPILAILFSAVLVVLVKVVMATAAHHSKYDSGHSALPASTAIFSSRANAKV